MLISKMKRKRETIREVSEHSYIEDIEDDGILHIYKNVDSKPRAMFREWNSIINKEGEKKINLQSG